ncbi:glycosyltransferase family 2 protein [Vaginella massiliensis]|uniref:glycosyltransferase family 2 protein n=1 Tax=Vaginella massiliensis TaxID=1816680 RepID=UPI00083892E7|nr:glycosyltransferase [Vaginella massiliensis]
MQQPLVSISIPVYKCEDFIVRCMESVKAQTYPNIETIFVNDATPDNSVALIEEFIQKNPQLSMRVVHLEKNQGLSVVRNRGIDESSGKYIYMLDSDDYITPDCIEKLVINSEKYNVEISVAETVCEYEDTGERAYLFRINSINSIVMENERIFKRFVYGDWPIIAPNKLYLKSFITKNNLRFVPNLYSQDELWAFHCAEKLNSISFIRDTTYIYYLHSKSTIANKKKVNFENHQTILEWFTKSYHESKNAERKKWIRKKIVNFKDLTMRMQYKFMRDDVDYWKQNYRRTQKAPGLKLSDYLTKDFTKKEKKVNIFYNLPAELGFRLFKKRYEG